MSARHPTYAKQRHRVVVVGGGFGGLLAARFLRKGDVEVTLVDRTNHHLFQPLLYQVATGILSEGQIAPLRTGTVSGLPLKQRKPMLARDNGFTRARSTVAPCALG